MLCYEHISVRLLTKGAYYWPYSVFCNQNQLKDRSVIQLYCKKTMVYLALSDGGGVVGVTDSDHKNCEFVGQ